MIDLHCLLARPALSRLALTLLLVLAAPLCRAATFYVAPYGSDSAAGTQAAPLLTIQHGINLTLNGDTVMVEDGTYTGTGNVDLDFGGKNITVTSVNGAATTVINCGGSSSADHRGFYFHSGETNAVVKGLTIQNGEVSGNTSNPTDLYSGGGVAIDAGCAVALTGCVLSDDTATNLPTNGPSFGSSGGGIYNAGSVTLTGCVFSGNAATNQTGNGDSSSGGGIYNTGGVTLTNCTLTGNNAGGEFTDGGGVFNAGSMLLTNCLLAGNSATGSDGGGGLENAGTITLTNCTVTGNNASDIGGGIFVTSNAATTLTNDIFYGDTGTDGNEIRNLGGTVSANYCDIQGGYAGNNLNADPMFLHAPTNLHLQPGSPCIGRGTHTGAPATDLDGVTRNNPPSIGAYEGGLPLTVPSVYPTIQAALNAAASGQTVTVADGTYTGSGNVDLDFGGRSITLTSASGSPARTIIDCGGSNATSHRGFNFHSGETAAVVIGFTIRNGNEGAQSGGGASVDIGCTVAFTGCLFSGSSANVYGGAVYNGGTVTLTDCIFTSNSAGFYGGGVGNAGTATLTNCLLTGNMAEIGGGIAVGTGSTTVTNCTFTNNSGGVAILENDSALTLTNDIFYGDTGTEIDSGSGSASVTFCDVQGGDTGTGNINANPLFVNAATGDLHLKPGSPCLGKGTASGAPATTIDGQTRPNPPSIGAYELPAAVDTSRTQLLWHNVSGQAALWDVNPTGAVTSAAYGPYSGWTAKAVSEAPDGADWLLWTNTNGEASLWRVSNIATNAYSTVQYGPYANFAAVSLSLGADGNPRLLWNETNGTASLWDINKSSGAFTHAEYGPYAGYTANQVASGTTVTDLLWTNTNGTAAGWRINNADGSLKTSAFGPFNGYSCVSLSVGSDDGAHLLWDSTSGSEALWSADFTTGAFSATSYGPISGWATRAIAVGPDNGTRLLWDNTNGTASLWDVTTSGFTHQEFGPFAGWMAVGVSAGL